VEDVDAVDDLVLRSTELRRQSGQLRTQVAQLQASSAELVEDAMKAQVTAASHLGVLTSILFAPGGQELPPVSGASEPEATVRRDEQHSKPASCVTVRRGS
jgi:hypothetical protein